MAYRHGAVATLKAIAVIFGMAVFAILGYVLVQRFYCDKDLVSIGSFVIGALTLIVLVIYTYDTNSMARISRDRWQREGVLAAAYSMSIQPYQSHALGTNIIEISNPSNLVCRARVNCDLRLYGDPVSAGDLFNGKSEWTIFPAQRTVYSFDFETVLQQKGKNVLAMRSEAAPANSATQFTMNLSIQFEDELDGRRTLPSRHHYFDFKQWAWIVPPA